MTTLCKEKKQHNCVKCLAALLSRVCLVLVFLYVCVSGGFRLKYVAPHSSETLDKAD